MPTPQAYLAVHQCAELAKQLKEFKDKEIIRIALDRQKRIAAMRLENPSRNVLGSSRHLREMVYHGIQRHD